MDWKGKRVVIIGAARQGLALAEYLAGKGAKVVLNDMRPAEELAEAQTRLADFKIEWVLGEHPISLAEKAKLLCPSGGVPSDLPLVVAARRNGVPISNDSQIFLEAAPCTVIGVTGSSGKTTTVTLVARILRAMEGQRVWLGGNIGNPLISNVDQMGPEDLAVVELSSFQLEWMTRSPQVGALLNLAPNHLDRHGTMAEYTAAKLHILDFQGEDDVAVIGREDKGAWAMASRARGRLLSFGIGDLPQDGLGTYVRGKQIWLRDEEGERPLLPLSAIELLGEHNLLNVLAASAIASAVGADAGAIKAGVEGFRGAPHRLQWVKMVKGADWYNDSIATSPQRTMAALKAFDQPLVLMLGGRDKGLAWGELIRGSKERARKVVLFGEVADQLKTQFNKAGVDSVQVANLFEAVTAAASAAQPGDVVLLSPGATSFDQYKDFEERGEHFHKLVDEL